MLRRRSFSAALLAGALPMPAIAQSTGLSAGKRGGDVIIGMTAAPPTLDAQATTAQAARNISLHMYEFPVHPRRGGQPQARAGGRRRYRCGRHDLHLQAPLRR